MNQFHKQLYRHNPNEGIIGDCHRTCIANILGLYPWEVPHFMIGEDEAGSSDKWFAERGLNSYYFVNPAEMDESLISFGYLVERDVLYIVTGESKTGVNHCVVAKGSSLIFDPSLDNSGIVGPSIYDSCYHAQFILPEPTVEMKEIYADNHL